MSDARIGHRHGPRSERRGLVALLLVTTLATCTTDHTPTGPGRGGRGFLAIRPVLAGPVNLAAFGFTIDSLRVAAIRPPSDTVVDTTVFFSPNSSTLRLSLSVELKASPETFYVLLQLRAGGQVFYRGVDTTQVSVGAPDTSSSASVTLAYVGPGAGLTRITIAPKDSVVTLGGTKQFRITADSNGKPVNTFFVHWSTSDTVTAPIDGLGVLHGPGARGTVLVRAVTPDNVRDSTPVTFIPIPTRLTPVSGGAQTASVATRLPLPLRVQVTASDAQGVKGIPVRFRALSGGGPADTVISTDGGGFAADTVTLGTVAGPQRFEAGVTGLPPDTFTVTGTAGAISAAQSVVTVSGSTVASGTTATLTLQAKDAFGNNLTTGGAVVGFAATGGTSTGSVGPPSDHLDGTYSATFTGLVAGTATTIGATVNGTAVGTTLPTIIVTPGAISAATSLISASSVTVASGASVTLTLQAKDAAGNALATGGATVVFSRSGGTSTGTVAPTQATDNNNGTYTAAFTGVLAGTATTIGATINGIAVTTALPTLAVTAGAISAAASVVTTSSGTVAAGASATLTLQAKDAAGNDLTTGGATVGFTASGGTSVGTIGLITDHGNGSYTATFTGTVAGTGTTIRATVNAAATVSTTSISVVPGNAVTAQSIVSVSTNSVASGGIVTLTLQARDSLGNAITTGGLTVAFTHSGGTSTGAIGGTTDHGNGTYTATFNALLAGTATTIGATIGGASVTSTLPTVTVTPGAISPATSVVSLSGATVASGASLTLTLQAKDAAGNAIVTGGATVVFSRSGGTSTGNIAPTPATDNNNGSYAATFTGVLAGTATTIGATINGTAVTTTLPTVTVTPGTISPATSVVTAAAGTVLLGVVDTLFLRAKDAAGNNLAAGGALVVFTQGGGTSVGSIGTTTDLGNGTYRALFVGTTTGTPTTIGATINAAPVTSTPLPTIQVTATVHTVDITADSTWTAALSPHIVAGYLRIRNGAKLTIALGATVKFNAGAGFQIGDTTLGESGQLVMDGTQPGTAPGITLTANTPTPTPGFWKGIEVQRNLALITWRRALIEWAGGVRTPFGSLPAEACILFVNRSGAEVDLDSVRIRQCVHAGIHHFGGASHVHRSEIDTVSGSAIHADFDARLELDSTVLRGAANNGLEIPSPNVKLLPSSGNDVFGSGNVAMTIQGAQLPGMQRQDSIGGNNANIIVVTAGAPVDTSFTLFRQPRGFVFGNDFDYRIHGVLQVSSPLGPQVTLDSNLVVRFVGFSGLVIGDSAGTGTGRIRSLGTGAVNQPNLTSISTPGAPGQWLGVEIGRLAAADTLKHVHIEFAGDSLPGRTVHRSGLWIRSPTAVPFALDSAQIVSSGSTGALQNSAGVVVTAQGGGVDIRRTVSASNAGSGFAFNVPLKLIEDTAQANQLYGVDAEIDGGSQVNPADSLKSRLGPGNLYPARANPGALVMPGGGDISGNLRDTLLLDGGSMTASGALSRIPGIAWRVRGPVVIDSGAALTIKADTVAFDDSALILVGKTTGATLRAIGSSTVPKLLTATPGHASWFGLFYQNLSQPDTLANVVIEKAGRFIPPPPNCRFQLECFSVLLGSIRFTNSSSFGLLLDSVTVRNAIAYAVEALPSGTGGVTIRHSQFYADPALFHSSTGAALAVTQSDISHYGGVVVVNNSSTPGDSVDATNNWWGDSAGLQVGSGGRDTLSLGQTAGYQTRFVPLATTPFFPAAIGPAANIVSLGVDSVQGVQAGSALLDSIRARVVDANGRGVAGQTVNWTTNKVTVLPPSSTTDVGGRAGAFWTVGTVAETDTVRASSGALPPTRFLVTVLPGSTVASTVDWQVLPAPRTLADSVHSHPGLGTDTVFYSSTNHTSAFKTNARDVFGNFTQPSFGPIFDQGPCSNSACHFPAADSVRGDTVYFRPPAVGDYVISGLYDGGTGGSDQIVLRVKAVAAGVRIDRNDTIPGVQSVPDSALFTSLCPVSGPFNAVCQREFRVFVVDSGGVALGNQNARFQWISPAFPDTIVTVDQTHGAPANDSALVSAHANGKRFVVAVDTASGSATHLKRDSLPITVSQSPASLVVAPDTISLLIGDTARLRTVALDQGGDTLRNPSVHWRIEPPYQGTLTILDTSIAGQAKVRLDSVILGQAQITALICCGPGTADTLVATGFVLTPVASVTVAPDTATTQVGSIVTPIVTLKDASNRLIAGRPISWTTSAAGVVAVATTGEWTAVGLGTATITATSEGVSDSAIVTVASGCAADPTPNCLLTAQDPALEPYFRSIGAQATTNITFTNSSAMQTVNVYWLDYGGQRQLYQTLGPGQSYVQATFTTHPWLVTDTAGTGIGIFYPVSVDAQAVVN